MKIEEQFLTKSKFTKLIENVVAELRIPYMDAIIKVCETNEIELEDIKKFISPVIKNKLENSIIFFFYFYKLFSHNLHSKNSKLSILFNCI